MISELFVGAACLAVGFLAGRSRRRLRLPWRSDVNVIDGDVLPMPDDENWTAHGDYLCLGGVSVWMSEILPSVTSNGVKLYSSKAERYGKAVLKAFRNRKSMARLMETVRS